MFNGKLQSNLKHQSIKYGCILYEEIWKFHRFCSTKLGVHLICDIVLYAAFMVSQHPPPPAPQPQETCVKYPTQKCRISNPYIGKSDTTLNQVFFLLNKANLISYFYFQKSVIFNLKYGPLNKHYHKLFKCLLLS